MERHEKDSGKIDSSKEAGEIEGADYWSLVMAARDGQKGLASGAERALQIVHDAKNPNHTYAGRPLIDYIAENLIKDEKHPAKILHDDNGKISKIKIRPDESHKNFPNFVLDVKHERANGKTVRELHEESIKEALKYVREAVKAPNRPIDNGAAEEPMNQKYKDQLLKVETAAVKGDVKQIIKMFQQNSHDEDLWTKMSFETSRDFGYPAVFEFNRTDDGKPYLAIQNRLANQMESWDVTVVFGKGDAQVLKYDDWNRIQFDKPSGRTVEQAAAETQIARLASIREQLSSKRCDFDQWHREQKPAGKASVRELLRRYNSHKDHPCEPDESEGP